MPGEFVLASGNKGKLREISEMLRPMDLVVRPQSDWQTGEAEETAPTFIENALAKARNAARHTGLPAIGDDSGLVVPSLNGEPGIFSARYAGTGANDRSNMQKLLAELEKRRATDRSAYFYCAMVLMTTGDDPAPLVATARWHGEILHTPRGEGGFGYDPVFAVKGTRYSAAELASAEKHRVSHRGQALRLLVEQLRERDNPC
jgi:XTP/dITP diphosphohydrolase